MDEFSERSQCEISKNRENKFASVSVTKQKAEYQLLAGESADLYLFPCVSTGAALRLLSHHSTTIRRRH